VKFAYGHALVAKGVGKIVIKTKNIGQAFLQMFSLF